MSSAEDRIDDALKVVLQGVYWDEPHHMAWVMDQVVRVLTRCPEVTKTSRYGETYREMGESLEYEHFVATYKDGSDGPETYKWDTGIAP